jgi:predicted transposase/invertase (TIGR01784 family)
LIAAKPEAAMDKARAMVPRLRASKQPKQSQRLLLQFIETVIVHQFPDWSREEIEKMLQVTDVSQTRVFKEAKEEGLVEGIGKGIEKGIEKVARRLLKKGHSVAEIVEVTDLTPAQVRKLSKQAEK